MLTGAAHSFHACTHKIGHALLARPVQACLTLTLSIRPLLERDLDQLRTLAGTIWQASYSALILPAQIDYMLADRYDAALIRAQLDDPEHFWRLAWWTDKQVGFAHARIEVESCKLDKLYIHPDYQRRGIGGALFNEVKCFAHARAATRLTLQVNRGNSAAIAAYKRYGFVVKEARVFDIGSGFVMDDFVMEMPL